MKRNAPTRRLFAVTALLATAMLAGCLENQPVDSLNVKPVAELETTQDSGMVGDEFTFDAQSSRDPDGSIVSWTFDFGDGTATTVESEDDARITHVYDQGGEYDVTVTVRDDGNEGASPKEDTATVRVAVNEPFVVEDESLNSEPLLVEEDSYAMTFEARSGVDNYAVDLTLQNDVSTAQSEARIVLVDSIGQELFNETVTIGGGETAEFSIDGEFETLGDGELRIIAEDGQFTANGELILFYDEGF